MAKAKELRVGRGTDPDAALGPVISVEAKQKIEGIIERASKQGAKVPAASSSLCFGLCCALVCANNSAAWHGDSVSCFLLVV